MAPAPHIVEPPAAKLTRLLLFLFVVLVVCPIRHWPLGFRIDDTWVFAINYAHANGFAVGKDIFWTSGPLGFLVFPQDFGNNLVNGLIFQTLLWGGLIAVLADLFFRAKFRLFNLALFVFLFALSAPLYWVNFIGTDNLLLACTLVLLVVFRWRGGFPRYLSALVFVGLIPLIKFTGGMIAAGALTGFLADRLLRYGRGALPEVAWAMLIPSTVALGSSLILTPSLGSFLKYLHASFDLAGGFSSAMSITGPRSELAAAIGTLLLIAGLLFLRAGAERVDAAFFCLFLAGPLFISVKHGFVRQDGHIINFFCFAALAIALICLTAPLQGPGRQRVLPVLSFVVLWTSFVIPHVGLLTVSGMITGRSAAQFIRESLDLTGLRKKLASVGSACPEELQVEPEVRAVIGGADVASLSVTYTSLAAAHLRPAIYPVVQRYSAYTPYLDGLTATWVRDKGPQFLLFDGSTIDDRNAWSETPGMWLETYRWYNTRLTGRRNLLLERRAEPRFHSLQSIGRRQILLSREIRLPSSGSPVFWSMRSVPTFRRKLLQLFWRVPGVFVAISDAETEAKKFRVFPEMLSTPVLGHLPTTISALAAVFQADGLPSHSDVRLQFEGAGMVCYAPAAELEFFRLIP